MHFHSVTGGSAVTRSQAVLWTVTCTGCDVKSYQSPVLTAVTLGLRCEVRPSRSGPQIPYLTRCLSQTLTQILGLTKEQPRAEIVEKRSHRVRFRFPLPLRSRLPLLIKRSSELHLVRKYTHSVSYLPSTPHLFAEDFDLVLLQLFTVLQLCHPLVQLFRHDFVLHD